MNAKQQRFVAEYLIDLNATQAAIRAGYSEKTANRVGPRLLSNVGIAKAIQSGTQKQLEQAGVTAQKVKDRIAQIAFQDLRQLYDEAGNLKPIAQLGDDAIRWIGGLEVIKKNAAAGDGVVDTIHKVKVHDPIKALELLAKHFGLLIEQVNHTGGIELKWKD